jgi:hypothetical protein
MSPLDVIAGQGYDEDGRGAYQAILTTEGKIMHFGDLAWTSRGGVKAGGDASLTVDGEVVSEPVNLGDFNGIA